MDSSPEKIGGKIDDLPIEDTARMGELVKAHKIDIAILAIPPNYAQKTADELVKAGVRAILNFAPISLKVPSNVLVKNENTAIEIESLSYFLTNS